MKRKTLSDVADFMVEHCKEDKDSLLHMAVQRAIIRAENAHAALTEALSVMRLMDGDGKRATAISAPEDGPVMRLCEHVGYGAVIDSAARQWFLKDNVGAFVSGPCAATVRDATKALERAIKEVGNE